MGREIRRVPVDFEWELNTRWRGFLMPDELHGIPCTACDGRGESPEAKRLHDLWYGYVPFRPEDNGSTPLTIDHPAVRAFAERNVAQAPEFYIPFHGADAFGLDAFGGAADELTPEERAIRREAQRLATMWNGQWSHHLNAADVAALVEAGRLKDLTHTWTREDGRQPKVPAVVPTPEQVNDWAMRPMSHDGINAFVCIRARCEREGHVVECSACGGTGVHWRDPDHEAAHEAWEPTPPPSGDGWQLWETVSEGSPISPVFPTADGLIHWMTTPAAEWGAMGPWSREQAAAFVNGPGWAPTFMSTPATGPVDGVTAVTTMGGGA